MIRLYAYVAVLFAMHACGLEIEQLPVNESDGPEKVTVALIGFLVLGLSVQKERKYLP